MRVQEPRTVCEVEYKKGKEVDGKTHIVGIDGVTVELDLCEAHEAKILAPVQALVNAADPSRVIDGTVAKYVCEHPGCDERFKHPTQRAAHYRRAHGEATTRSKGRAGNGKRTTKRADPAPAVTNREETPANA